MVKKLIYILFLVSIFIYPIYASQEGSGTTGGSSLKIGVNARMIGLAEAYTAVADDVNAISGNIAGLGCINGIEFTYSHVEWIQDVRIEHIGYAQPLFKDKGNMLMKGVIGVGLQYLYIPSFEQTGGTWGRKTGYNNRFGNFTGVLAYAMTLKDLYLGVGFMFMSEYSSIGRDGIGDFGSSINLGGLYTLRLKPFRMFGKPQTGRSVKIGLTLENMTLARIGDSGLPFLIKAGVSTDIIKNLIIAFDMQFPISFKYGLDNNPRFNIGLEYWIIGKIAIRGGWRIWGYDSDGFSFGIGTKLDIAGKVLMFDFSYAPAMVLKEHLFNITFGMKFPGKKPKNNEASILYYKGIYYYTNEKYEEAISIWKQVLRIDPRYEKAKEKIKEAERLLQLKKVVEDEAKDNGESE